jgi:hypothetical protein
MSTIRFQRLKTVQIRGPGIQGLPGEAGLPGTSSSTSLIASEALNGQRVVIADGVNGARYADAANINHFAAVIGITTAAAAQNSPVFVQSSNFFSESSWNWLPNLEVFLSINGFMTQNPPTALAFLQKIGYAVTPTKIWIELSDPIVL